jgi:hypothetical protein
MLYETALLSNTWNNKLDKSTNIFQTVYTHNLIALKFPIFLDSLI